MTCQRNNGVCPIDDSGDCCGKHELRIVAVIPVRGRLPLLKHTIERLYKKNGVYKVICVADGHDERKVIESCGAVYIHHSNKPLGKKWNHGFVHAQNYNPDACLFVGSSDWLSDNWLAEMGPYLKEFDLIGTLGCHFLDIAESFRLVYWPGYIGRRQGESIGIGRLISSRVLAKLQWKPFDDALDVSLDYSMQQRVITATGKLHLVDNTNIKSVSISTNRWINKHVFQHHWNGPLKSEVIDPDKFINENFPEAKQVFND